MHINDLRTIGIVGPGLLGASVALGLKAAGVTARIVGIGHRKSSIRRAIEIGAIDAGSLKISGLDDAQLVIVATPIGLFEQVLAELADVVADGTIITDVGSTKRHVCRLAATTLAKNVHFVGSHPVAGSEQRGVEFARADLLKNATCIITPQRTTNRSAVRLVRALWTTVGMRIESMSPAQHDKILAKISHLPHMVAAALVNACSARERGLSGTGFLDATRMASGDVRLWYDIVSSNADQILLATAAMRRQLDVLDRAVSTGNARKITEFLASAKRDRDALVKLKIRRNCLDR